MRSYSRPLTRRRLLHQGAVAGLAAYALPRPDLRSQSTVNLPLPGGPDERDITTAFPQKGAMILQRTRPPLLETPFEVFDKGRVHAERSVFRALALGGHSDQASTSTNSA